ncbi:MAG: AsmA family protein [Rhodoblastus sp.]|nr:AsmA family protein [Rhodoblastus sp.]
MFGSESHDFAALFVEGLPAPASKQRFMMFGLRSRALKQADETSQPATGIAHRARLWPQDRLGRTVRVVGGVLAAAGLGAAIAPWAVSRTALREEIAAQLRSSSGLYVFVEGPSTFSLLPSPHVRLGRVNFVEPQAALVIKTENLTGQLRWLPLLTGRLELQRAELMRPQLTIDIDGRPMTKAGAVVRAADAKPATPEAVKADRARLGVISFVDGSAILRRGGVEVETLDHIDATLDWPTVSSPAALDGAATWRGQRGTVALWIARPSEALRGEASRLTLQLKSPVLTLSANGEALAGSRPHFTGRLVASTDQLRDVVRLLHGAIPLPVTLGPASLDATADASHNGLDLAKAQLKLDNTSYEGSLSWRVDDVRPQLSGTLATSTLDLRDLVRNLPPLVGRDGHFNRETIAWRDQSALDIDLRLSASRATYDRLLMRDVAGALLLRAGRLEASLADASMYKGTVKARLVMSPAETGAGVEMKSVVEARGVDIGALGWDKFGATKLAGAANVNLTLEGAGSSADQIARSLKGRGDIDFGKGEIVGLDVARTLRRIEKRPLASGLDINSGRTPFASARMSAEIAAGVATINDGLVQGEGFAMSLSGASQIADRQIALHASVASADTKGDARPDAPAFAFDVVGQWDNAALVPDAPSFIRRSGAARPLLAPRKAE